MDKITIFGIGSGGGNVVNYILDKLDSNKFDLVCINTKKQMLESSKAHRILQIGKNTCAGLGCGGDVSRGIAAAEESLNEITHLLENTTQLIIIAGLGGGCSTGATQIIAKFASEMKIRTTAILTIPFSFEGRRRNEIALEGIEEIKHYIDNILILHNSDILKNHLDKNVSLSQAFKFVDEKIYNVILALN